jgi:hypothetical protein
MFRQSLELTHMARPPRRSRLNPDALLYLVEIYRHVPHGKGRETVKHVAVSGHFAGVTTIESVCSLECTVRPVQYAFA